MLPILDYLIPHHQLPFLVAQHFIMDYDEIMPFYDFSEKMQITNHLLYCLQLQQQYILKEDETLYKLYIDTELLMLGKFGRELIPYKEKNFLSLL